MFSRAGMTLVVAVLAVSPVYASPKDELAQTHKEIEQGNGRQAKLNQQQAALQKELDALQQRLVELARNVQESEAALSAAEDKLRILGEQLQKKNDALKARRKDLGTLVQGALHLSRLPPEAMVMMPGDVNETMTAARALKMSSDSIKQETESIGQQIGELNALKDKVVKDRDALNEQQIELSKQRQGLSSQLAERKALQEKLGRQQKQEAQALAKLAKKSDNLQQLITTVEQEEKKKRIAEELNPDERVSGGTRSKLRSFVAARGHIRPPVAGKIVQLFGVQRNANETTKGILIATRENAGVLAPYDSEVVFSGPFLNYGRMVILRHSDGFHTLLAGLAKIDVQAGQFLLEGEPIGAMGDTGPIRLYVEMRKDNQPVDPTPWFNSHKNKTE
jgi:septal ring factor EnvC (AmiA/AmiB activator)